MNGTIGTARRMRNLTIRLAAVVALALLLAGAVAPAVHAADNNPAPAMDKSKFKEGCESGGGSYIENNDGSFQCNLKDGGTIKCPSTTSQCTYTPLTRGKTHILGGVAVNSAGVFSMLGAQPTPVATKTAVLSGKVNSGAISATAP